MRVLLLFAKFEAPLFVEVARCIQSGKGREIDALESGLLAELHRHEAWCRLLFKRWLSELPLFRDYWSKTISDERSAIAARSTEYWGLKAPDGALLQFRLTVEYVRPDPRFRLLCFLPADAETIQRCALWARR